MTATKKPILMSTPMILSLNDDLKTQTRRTSGLEGYGGEGWIPVVTTERGKFGVQFEHERRPGETEFVACPYGRPGGTLWVREGIRRGGAKCDCDQSFDVHPPGYHDVGCACWSAHYIADGRCAPCDNWGWKNKALPAIHMPRGMCRYELDLHAIRVERLQTICREDAIAEGISRATGDGVTKYWWPGAEQNFLDPRDAYRAGWEWLNGPTSWAVNPFCWVLEFIPRRVR